MKTLRLLRNIAVLFILVMGLLASRPGPAVAHAAGKSCGFKLGHGCRFDKSGHCQNISCAKFDPFCPNTGCM